MNIAKNDLKYAFTNNSLISIHQCSHCNDHLFDDVNCDLNYELDDCIQSTESVSYIQTIEPKYSYRDVVDDASSIQCKLFSVIKGSNTEKKKLINIFHKHVLNYNKIAIEGMHLFNLYVLYLFRTQKFDIHITANTIAKCMRVLVENVCNFRVTKNKNNIEEAKLIKKVKNKFFNFTILEPNTFIYDGDSYTKPLDSFAVMAFSNIMTATKLNFKKYQARYILFKLQSIVSDTEVSNGEIKFVLNRIQRTINDEEWHISNQEEKITNIMEKLNTDDKLNKFISDEKQIILNTFGTKIKIVNNEVDGINQQNLIKYLNYFSYLLAYIESIDGSRFPIIPHFQPQMNFIHFDSKTLYNVFCEWKNKSKKLLTPNIFDRKFDFYFHKMFSVKNKYRSLYRKYPSVRSISTNGLVISITFVKLKKIKFLADKELRDKHKHEKEVKKEQKKLNKQNISSEQNKITDAVKKENININKIIREMTTELNKLKKKPRPLNENDADDEYHICLTIKECKREIKRNTEKYLSKKVPEKVHEEVPKEIHAKKHLTVNMKNGLYEADELTCTTEILDTYDVIGVDPGGSPMAYFYSESGAETIVHKMEYFDLAHITKNTKLMSKMMNTPLCKIKNEPLTDDTITMQTINTQLSLTTYKTSNMVKYMEYVSMIRKYWILIWKFYSQNSILNMKFDTYTNKQKAIAEMVRRIIERLKDKKNVDKYCEDSFDEIQFNKPKLIAFGKGNGSMTITNTKGSSSKGPIKMLANELSKHFPVILVGEDYTSQLCCLCGEQMEAVPTYHFPSEEKIYKNSEDVYKKEYTKISNEKSLDCLSKYEKHEHAMIMKEKYIRSTFNGIEETKKLREEINKMKKNKIENKKEIEEKEKKVSKLGYYKNCYKLRRCVRNHDIVVEMTEAKESKESEESEEPKKVRRKCKMFERNKNASKNMIKVMQSIIIEGNRGMYIKK